MTSTGPHSAPLLTPAVFREERAAQTDSGRWLLVRTSQASDLTLEVYDLDVWADLGIPRYVGRLIDHPDRWELLAEWDGYFLTPRMEAA